MAADDQENTPPRTQQQPTREQALAYLRAHMAGVPYAERQMFKESSNSQSAVSKKGAIGLLQVMPKTAAEMGYDPHDWRQNIDASLEYSRGLLKTYNGDMALAVAAYNLGRRGLRTRQNGDPTSVPKVIQPYVRSILPDWQPGKRLIAPGYPGGAPLQPAPPQPASPAPAQAPPPAAPPQSGSAAAPPHRLGFFDPRNGAPPPGFGLLSDPNFPGVFTHQTPWGDVWPLLPGPNRRGPKD